MHPTDKAARVAGAVYLSMVVTAPFSLIYIPSALFVRGNATATANNILAHETLFRLGIVADLITSVIFICLVLALSRLLSGVNKTSASLMVALAALLRLIANVSLASLTVSPLTTTVIVLVRSPGANVSVAVVSAV